MIGCLLNTSFETVINPGVYNAISWNQEIQDTHGFFPGSGTAITIPGGMGGIYCCYVRMPTMWQYNLAPFLLKNGNLIHKCSQNPSSYQGGDAMFHDGWILWEGALSAGDTLSAGLHMPNGSAFLYYYGNKRIFNLHKVASNYACSLSGGGTTIPTDDYTLLSWTGEDYDYGSMFAGGSGVTIPENGIYHVNGYVDWSGINYTVGVSHSLSLYCNSNRIAENRQCLEMTNAYANNTLVWEGALSAGDNLQLAVWHNYGSNVNVQLLNWSPHFCVRQVIKS